MSVCGWGGKELTATETADNTMKYPVYWEELSDFVCVFLCDHHVSEDLPGITLTSEAKHLRHDV